MKCLVCGKEGEKDFQVFKLTDEEKVLVPNPRDEYTYCNPCWAVLSHPIQGPMLMKGLAQQGMRMLGMPDPIAESKASAYHQKMTDLIFETRKKS